jgi:3-oxoacyl-[acyl-carrier protein] reductase
MSTRPVAIITGAGTGVGAATALALAQRGWDLVVNYSRSADEAQASAAACRDAGADALPWRADVADDGACRAMVGAAVARWGRVDALVNNAGITAFAGADWNAVDAAMFHDVIGVNVLGSFQMVRACAPHLKAAGGAVVNVSSIAGSLGIGSSAPYIASKGALNALTLHMARTLAPRVRVNAVCPGMIATRWFVDGLGAQAYEQLKARSEASAPLGRICSAQDVADAVVWLIVGARTVTGETLLLDGGLHLGAAPAIQRSA